MSSCSLCKKSEISGSKVLRGIDACEIPQEIPSSICCPKYFFNNGDVSGIVIPPNTQIEVINVPVTTTSPNERVRLDSMVFTAITTIAAATDYSFRIVYRLFRDTTQLTTINFSHVNLAKQPGVSALIEDASNITWTDIPVAPGTYNYRITVERFTFNEENIANVFVFSRSIDAIVFPSENFS